MYSIEPTSRPRVGCAAISSLIGRDELARDDDLLLVAARERADRRLDAHGVRTSNSFDSSVRAAVDGVAVEPQAVRERLAVVRVEDQVSAIEKPG